MPKVMIRRDTAGKLSLYVAKQDLEENIIAMQHEGPGQWGGTVTLGDGSQMELDVLDTPPSLPITLRARRL